MRRDFVENSNDSYWMTNPAHPLTGFPRVIGQAGDRDRRHPRVRTWACAPGSALSMVMTRISGTDGLGPPGFTFQRHEEPVLLRHPVRRHPGQAATGGHVPVVPRRSGAHQHRQHHRRRRLLPTCWPPGTAGRTRARAARCCSAPSGSAHWACRAAPGRTPSTPRPAHDPVRAEHRQHGRPAGLRRRAGRHAPPRTCPTTSRSAPYQYVLRNGKQIPLPGGPGDPLRRVQRDHQSRPVSIRTPAPATSRSSPGRPATPARRPPPC